MSKSKLFYCLVFLFLFSGLVSAACRNVYYLGDGDAEISLSLVPNNQKVQTIFPVRIDSNPFSPSGCNMSISLEFNRLEGLEVSLARPYLEFIQMGLYREYNISISVTPTASASGVYSGNLVFGDINHEDWVQKYPILITMAGSGVPTSTAAPTAVPSVIVTAAPTVQSTLVSTPAPTPRPTATSAPAATPVVVEELPPATYEKPAEVDFLDPNFLRKNPDLALYAIGAALAGLLLLFVLFKAMTRK
ncbi:MAG: hypothetical protein ACE5DI_00625 [Candidatus Micrarchaeia archaeon]